MGLDDEIENAAQDLARTAKEAVGNVTHDDSEVAGGTKDQAAAGAKQTGEDVEVVSGNSAAAVTTTGHPGSGAPSSPVRTEEDIMENETHARTHVIDVALPASLTEPLPEDASPLTVAARTAAVTAIGVDGVHHLGGVLERAADQVRSRLGRAASALGVKVDDADGTLDVQVSLVVTYPEPMTQVAEEVRAQVAHAVAQVVGRPANVDVRVTDVHGPFDDEPSTLSEAVEHDGTTTSPASDSRP